MPEYKPKPFVCSHCFWVIGESYREERSRITQLRVRREAQDPSAAPLPADLYLKVHLTYAVVKANDCEVLCGHCGCSNPWVANQTAISEMLERRYAKHENLLETKRKDK